MYKIKISSIAAAMAVFLMFFTSCTNEELLPHEPDAPVLNRRIVFNVNTGKSMVCTRASAEDEQAIRSLGVFIVKPDGNLAEGVIRFYEAKDLINKKLTVSIPVDIMETTGVKAYLVANGPDKTQCDGLKTEQEVLGLVATTKPEEISTKGIPMASGAISLNFTGGMATVDANMKRVMSTLCATVIKSKGVFVGPSDFTFKVHGISRKEGYYLKDECKDTGVEQVWNTTSKSQDEEVSLGYFYQSKKFQVEVISQSTSQSRTVEIPLEKAQTRNKKYVLKIHPKPASGGTGEFTVTVEAWEETEADVDFEKGIIRPNFMEGKVFKLRDEDMFKSPLFPAASNFAQFLTNTGDFELVDLELKNCMDEQKRGIFQDPMDHLILHRTKAPISKKIDGELTYTLQHGKSGYRIKTSVPVCILPPSLRWNDEFTEQNLSANFEVINGILVCHINNTANRELNVDLRSIRSIDGKLPQVEVARCTLMSSETSETPPMIHGIISHDIGALTLVYDAPINGYEILIGLRKQDKTINYLWLRFE